MRKLIVAAGFALACGPASDVGTSPDLSSQPTELYGLKVGESITVGDREVVVEFLGVPTDSRCASTVVCAWAGDAAAILRVSRAGTVLGQDTLHTLPGFPQTVTHEAVHLQLIELDPYPVEPLEKIEQQDYLLTLGVRRLGP